jgi:hypothetical protein
MDTNQGTSAISNVKHATQANLSVYLANAGLSPTDGILAWKSPHPKPPRN